MADEYSTNSTNIIIYMLLCAQSHYCNINQSAGMNIPSFPFLLCKNTVMLLLFSTLVATLPTFT